MRKIVLLLGLLLPMAIFAQTDFVRYSGKGNIILSSGETLTGVVGYNLFAPGKVEILPDGQSREVKYNSDEVKEFTLDEKHYYSVKVKGGEVKIGNNQIFVQSMVPDDYKLKIFLSETQPPVVTDGNFSIDKMYYASIPGDATAYALSDLKFTPFKKMAGYLSDCAAIVEKINGKVKGYTVPLATTDEFRLQVFTTIANEYQSCK